MLFSKGRIHNEINWWICPFEENLDDIVEEIHQIGQLLVTTKSSK